MNGGCGGLVAMEDGHNTFKVITLNACKTMKVVVTKSTNMTKSER
jgi:hypothetical protein